MAKRNIIAALILLAFSIWYGVLTANLPNRSLPDTPGPAFFPTVIAVIMLLLSLTLLARGIMQARGAMATATTAHIPARAVWMLVLFALFLAALPYAGFELAGMPFFAAMMLVFGSRNWLVVIAAGIAIPVALGLVFRHIFQIVLPHGVIW